MFQQFIGKPYFITLAGLAGIFLLAILSFETVYTLPLLMLITIFVFAISLKKLEYGVLAVFAELFANSHGHLISANVNGFDISLRMAVFVGLMVAWFVLFISRQAKVRWQDQVLIPFVVLFIAVLLGFVLGGLNDPQKAFSDGNAYMFIAMILPILCVEWNAMQRRLLLQVFAAAVTWVVLLTLGIAFIFTHVHPESLGEVYRFLRDTRTAEMTLMTAGIFRVFLQAQFSVLIMLFILLPFLWIKDFGRSRSQIVIVLSFLFAVIFISLSRSFWVGGLAAGIIFLVLSIKYLWPGWSNFGKVIGSIVLSKVGGIIILLVVILFPIGYRGASLDSFASLFSNRTTGVSDQAIDSRWKLLPPMTDQIKENPVLGYGFGKEIEFITDDPRIRAEQPDGRYRTFSFEWGWLELWIKMGLLGPLAFIYLFFVLLKGLWPYLYDKQYWIGLGLISALTMLYATHLFSPYLNHPLGLGLIMFIVPFLTNTGLKQKKGIKVPILIKKPAVQPTSASMTKVES